MLKKYKHFLNENSVGSLGERKIFTLDKNPSGELRNILQILSRDNISLKIYNNLEEKDYLLIETDEFNNIIIDGEKKSKKTNFAVGTTFNDILIDRFGVNTKLYYYHQELEITHNFTQVKIDKHVVDKVAKLTENMGFNKYSYLREKLDFLNNPELYLPNSNDEYKHKLNGGMDGEFIEFTIQNTLSAIILLDHLAEIRHNFNPSASGFLFESFIAGLIGGIAYDDNAPGVDIIVPPYGKHKAKNYQMKLYSDTSLKSKNITKMVDDMIARGPSDENFLMIGNKNKKNDNIDIYLIPFNKKTLEEMSRTWDVYKGKNKGKSTTGYIIDLAWVKNLTFQTDNKLFDNRIPEKVGTLKLTNFTEKIERIKVGLGDILEELWKDIKTLHNDVESLMITDDKKMKERNKNESTYKLKNEAIKTSKKIDINIRKLYGIMKKK